MMYKFYGQLEQDRFIFENYFTNKREGISIECGAFDGITESCTFFLEQNLGWNCINIEASPLIFEMLEVNRPNSLNFNLGLGEEEKILSFNHVIHPIHGQKFGNGSFNHKANHKSLLISEKCTFEEHSVMCTTYENLIDNLMSDFSLEKEIDLLVLDVEGFELEVIKGMMNSKYLPKVFCVEFTHVGLEQLKQLLNNLNYEFDLYKDSNAYFIKK